jgi:hypothetical protein
MEKLVNFIRTYKSLSLVIIAGIWGAALGGCSEGVGDPCMPEYIEKHGFSDKDIYIEASSVQCETRVCGVFKFKGNPKEIIEIPGCTSYVEERVFCTCRCRAPSGAFATCSCPDGYECSEDILEAAGEGLRGGYCVKTGVMETTTDNPQCQVAE